MLTFPATTTHHTPSTHTPRASSDAPFTARHTRHRATHAAKRCLAALNIDRHRQPAKNKTLPLFEPENSRIRSDNHTTITTQDHTNNNACSHVQSPPHTTRTLHIHHEPRPMLRFLTRRLRRTYYTFVFLAAILRFKMFSVPCCLRRRASMKAAARQTSRKLARTPHTSSRHSRR